MSRDAAAIDAFARAYRTGVGTGEPPRLLRVDIDRGHALVTVLGNGAPQVASSLHAPVVAALRAVRVASHEADVIGLLGVGEYLDATAKHRTPSLAAVRTRYEREVRPPDPTLEPWNDVMSGATLRRARAVLDVLGRAVKG